MISAPHTVTETEHYRLVMHTRPIFQTYASPEHPVYMVEPKDNVFTRPERHAWRDEQAGMIWLYHAEDQFRIYARRAA